MGDFNARHIMWKDKVSNMYGNKLVSELDNTSFSIVSPESPTFVADNGSSVIDFAIVSNKVAAKVSQIWSDDLAHLYTGAPMRGHLPVHFTIKTPQPSGYIKKEKPVTKTDINSMEWKEWTDDLEGLLKEQVADIVQLDDRNSVWNILVKAIATSTDNNSSTKNPSPHSKPFWTPSLVLLEEKLRDARKKYNLRNTDANKEEMMTVLEEFDQVRRKECHDWILKRTANLNVADTRKFWKEYRRIFSPKADNKTEALLNDSGVLLTDNKEIEEELFKTFFEGAHLSKGHANFDEDFKTETEKEYEELVTNDFKDPDQLPYTEAVEAETGSTRRKMNDRVSSEEILQVIKDHKPTGTSFDKENIHPKMLNHLGPIAIKVMEHLFNLCFDNGVWQWNMAEVIFLRKEGKTNYSQPGAYRPISITSYVGKLYEKIIAIRLDDHFKSGGILDEDQEGFTKARNTVRYLNRLNLSIKADIEKKLTVLCLFVDFEKAFDSVWKRGLIVKLYRAGVEGKMLAILNSFLMNRMVQLNVNGIVGVLRKCLEIGLPQGSALSPILFKFFLHDLCSELVQRNIKLYKFADDGTLKASGETTQICLGTLMVIMHSLQKWCACWRMLINCLPNKTEVVCFGTAEGDRSLIPDSFRLGNDDIKLVSHTKVLGLIMDENLTYQNHSNMVHQKLLFRWVTICKYSNRNWGFNQKVIVRLTKTLFLSVMFYAGLVWMKDSNMKAIKQLWYKLVKSGVGAVFNIKLALGEVILGMPPLEVLQKVYSVKHYLKIGIFQSDTDRLRLLISDADTLMVPELRAAMKEVYLFLKWKLTRIPEAFTLNEKMIIEGKEYDQFSALSIKACSYSKGIIRIYSEFMWQGYINNIYQMEGECRIPTVSCQSLHVPVYTTRDQEVLFMSLFYKNNLMEAFLYSIKRADSPLCLCGVEAQTAVHALLRCSLVLNINKAELYESLGGVGAFSEDIVTFLDYSRDKDFVNACIKVFMNGPKQFRTKIILEKLNKSTSQNLSLSPSTSLPY